MRHFCVLLFSVIAFVIFAITGISCGVDSVNYIESPSTNGHTVYWNTEDRAQHYFSFYTSESGFAGDFNFKGTSVLYKIYNNVNDFQSLHSSISSLSEASQATTLKNSYKYQELTNISPSGNSQYVEIRLSDYAPSFSRGIKVNNNTSIPLRNNNKGFNFKSGNSDNPTPDNEDDYKKNASFTENGTYYVDLYAVGWGNDRSGNNSYSSVLHLGTVPIKTSWY